MLYLFINTPSDVAKPAPGVVSNNYQKDRQTAVHKEYVETNYFRKNNGNLDMKNHAIKNIKEFVEDDSSQSASDAQKFDVVNWGKIHEIRGDLKREINAVEYEALNRKNPNPMEDDIDMANHKIINLADPTNNQDVAHKKYVDDRIKAIPGGDTSDLLKLDGSRVMTGNLQMGDNFITGLKDPNPSDSDYAASVNFVNKTIDDRLKYSVQSSDTSNAFQYVMDDPAGQFYDEDDIKGIRKTDKDFHKINKETYEMQLLLDSRGYYSSRLGVNMYILPNGEYSLVYELYYPNTIDSSTVQISAVSSVETVSKVTTNVFNNHTRSITHLHKYNNVAPNRLMIDMVLKNKAGISYVNELTIFVIVYGVSGYVNNVHTSVWDRLFEVTNNSIKFEAPIDMNGHNIDMKNGQIKGLEDGNENNDSVNVKQLNEMESNITNYVKAEIDKSKADVTTDVTNNHNLFLILYNYIMKNGTKVGILRDLYFTDSRESRTANTYEFDLRLTSTFTFYYVFKHNTSTNSFMTIRMTFYKSNPGSLDPELIFLNILFSKNQIKISMNSLINEPHLRSINIPNIALGKQIWFWMWIQGRILYFITSGSKVVTLNLMNIGLIDAFQFVKLNVDDSPFNKVRGLITSNVYNNNSVAYGKVREFERAQGTIV